MLKRRLQRRHSRTAILTAFYRAIGNKDYKGQRFGADDLAEIFLPLFVRILIKNKRMRLKGSAKDAKRMPGVKEYVLARTAFIDDIFIHALNEAVPQIVLLGAGYDTRAHRFEENNTSSRIFELDIAETQNRKKRCLKKNHINIPEQLTHIPIDFNNESINTVLQRAGFNNDQKVLFIWEGVCMYLDPTSVDTVLHFISQSSHPESTVVFDYAIMVSKETCQNYYGAREILEMMKRPETKESFNCTIDEKKIVPFLNQRGLNPIAHLDHHQIEKWLEPNDLGHDLGDDIEPPLDRPNGMFRLAIASPAYQAIEPARSNSPVND